MACRPRVLTRARLRRNRRLLPKGRLKFSSARLQADDEPRAAQGHCGAAAAPRGRGSFAHRGSLALRHVGFRFILGCVAGRAWVKMQRRPFASPLRHARMPGAGVRTGREILEAADTD